MHGGNLKNNKSAGGKIWVMPNKKGEYEKITQQDTCYDRCNAKKIKFQNFFNIYYEEKGQIHW